MATSAAAYPGSWWLFGVAPREQLDLLGTAARTPIRPRHPMKIFLCIVASLALAGGLLGLVLSATVFGEMMGLLALLSAFGLFGAVGIMERQDAQIKIQAECLELQKDNCDQLAKLLSKIDRVARPGA